MKCSLFAILVTCLTLFIGCSSDSATEPKKTEHAPLFGLILPQNDSAIYAGNTVEFLAVLIDYDKDIAGVKIYINEELLSNSENPGFEMDTLYLSNVRWQTDQCSAGNYRVKMELSDKAGNLTDTTLNITIKKLHEWSKTYGYGSGWRSAQTTDSGFVINTNASLFKIDKNGNKKWEMPIQNSDSDFYPGTGVIALKENGCYSCANYFNTGTSDDIQLMKLNSDGTKVWERLIEGEYPQKMTADKEENIYLASSHKLYKIKANGQDEWVKDSTQYISDIYCTPDDGILTAGTVYSVFASDSSVIYLAKTDKNGTEQWKTTFNLHANLGYGHRIYLDKASNGDYLAAIRCFLTNGNSEWVLLIRFSEDGTIKSMKDVNYSASYYFYKLVADRNNGFFLLSYNGIAQFDSDGKFKETVLNTSMSTYDLIPTYDNKYFMSGSNLGYIWAAKIGIDLKKQKLAVQKNYLEAKRVIR